MATKKKKAVKTPPQPSATDRPIIAQTQTPAQPTVPNTVYISFCAEVTTQTTETLLAVMAEQAARHTPRVYLLLSTLGGQVISGMNLYNVMRAMPFRLITHNVGSVNPPVA